MNKIPVLFPLHFSASKLESLHKCQMYTFRENIQHLGGSAKNPDLIAGGLIAKACEIVRTSYFDQGISEKESIELGKIHILDGQDTGDNIKTNENVAYCLEKYFKKFRLSEALPPCKLADGTHAVEYAFSFDLGIPHPDYPDRNILFIGRLDYLCEKVTLGKTFRYGLDEKSCKTIYRVKGGKAIDYKKEADQYRTNGQVLSYSWGARELGISLESFLIRRIPIMSTWEEAFELEIPITNFAIDQWYLSTYNLILELVEKYKVYKKYIYGNPGRYPHEVFYPANQNNACMSYSRTCKYISGCLCKEGEQLLKDEFTQMLYSSKLDKSILLEDYILRVEAGEQL